MKFTNPTFNTIIPTLNLLSLDAPCISCNEITFTPSFNLLNLDNSSNNCSEINFNPVSFCEPCSGSGSGSNPSGSVNWNDIIGKPGCFPACLEPLDALFVPKYRELTINGVTYSLSIDRSWTIPGFANPMSTLGAIIYGGVAGIPTSLLGNTTTTKKFLSQVGNGVNSAAPIWEVLDLTPYVPYVGATQDLNMGIWSIASTGLTLNGLTASRLVATNGSKTLESITGTGIVKLTSGTISYLTDNSINWNTAYNDSIINAAVTGTATKTLTLNQQDGGTVTASWSDIDTGLTSVGLSMPSAFSVANSPLTANGTLAVTGAGVASQYVRGDGTLANFPTTSGGGSSVSYYFNGSVNQGTILGNVYYELNKVPIIGVGTDFTINANGYIAQFITDANDPALLEIPAGNWNFEMFFSVSSGGGSPSFYVELYKYNGTAFTLIASNSATPEGITNGTAIDLYTTALAVPQTTLTLTDRLAIKVYVTHSGRTIKLHTENSHLCQVITTFSTGLTALNGLTSQVQYLAVGTTGADFNISSATDTHTFNLPTASAINRGALSSADWSAFNGKLTNPMTTEGDIIYGGASGVATRLAKGTNTWFLRAGATIPEYFNLFGTANSWSATQTINGVEVSSSAIIQNTTTAIYRINNQTGYNRIIGGTTANVDPTLTMYASSSGAPNLITYDAEEHRIRLLNSTNLAVFTSTSATFSVPLTLSNITSGSVLFAGTSGLVSQDNGKFRYLPTGYNSNAMLMVNATAGSPTPNATLHVEGSSISSSQNVVDFRSSAGTSLFQLRNNNAIFLGSNASFEQGGSGASISFITNFSRSLQITLDTNVGGSNFGKLRISGGVANTSATTDVAMFALTGTINQTTPISGVIRGILSNAVLTSAYNYKAFTFTHTAAYAPNAAITNYSFADILPNINATVAGQFITALDISLTGADGGFAPFRNALRLNGGGLVIGHTNVTDARLLVRGTTADSTAFNFRFQDSAGTHIIFGRNDGFVSSKTFQVNNGAFSSPISSAILEIKSTTQGLLLPRMTTAEMTAIGSPVAGLMVYDTTVNKSYTYDGAIWQAHW